jgi:hypothetical protein
MHLIRCSSIYLGCEPIISYGKQIYTNMRPYGLHMGIIEILTVKYERSASVNFLDIKLAGFMVFQSSP